MVNEFVSVYRSVIWVCLAYGLVYYAILTHGLFVKLRVARQCKEAGEPFLRYTGNYPELLASDRAQLNMLEHMPTFLMLLWLQALVVSPDSAAWLGGFYVLVRATYPLFLGTQLTRSFPRRVLINTFSGYLILTVMFGWQVYSLVTT